MTSRGSHMTGGGRCGLDKIAAEQGGDTGTVQRVKAELAGAE